jgi:hypothetical protein
MCDAPERRISCYALNGFKLNKGDKTMASYFLKNSFSNMYIFVSILCYSFQQNICGVIEREIEAMQNGFSLVLLSFITLEWYYKTVCCMGGSGGFLNICRHLVTTTWAGSGAILGSL